MKLFTVIIIAALIVLIFTGKQPETYTQPPPAHTDQININKNVDTSMFKLSTDPVTPDMVSDAVVKGSQLIKSSLNLCTQAIDTEQMRLYSDDKGRHMLTCSIMYMVTNSQFPYGMGLRLTLLDGDIIQATTQATSGSLTDVQSYSDEVGADFLPASALIVIPKSSSDNK